MLFFIYPFIFKISTLYIFIINEMNLNQILNNIYGDNSSQSFDHVRLSGGNVFRRGKVKYIDCPNSSQDVSPILEYRSKKVNDYIQHNSLSGGLKAKSASSSSAAKKIWPNAEYIEDEQWKKFVDKFFLHFLITNAHKNAIYVIPTEAELKKMVTELSNKLKENNIEECSPEASCFAAKTDLLFKNNIFDVFGRDSPTNNGFQYQLSNEFPENDVPKVVLRRTNRLSNVYFMRPEKDGLTVSTSEKFGQDSEKLKFVAKCDNDVFLFKGVLPPPLSPKAIASNVVTPSLEGGAKKKRKNNLKSYFKRLLNKNKGDIDFTAYEFIGSVGLNECEHCGTSDCECDVADRMKKYYSGDFVHTAFSILSDADKFNNIDLDCEYDGGEIDYMHESILDKYKPIKNNINMNDALKAIKNIYNTSKKCKQHNESNKTFMNNLKKIYGSYPLYMLKADVASAIVKKNGDLDFAFSMLNDIDVLENGGELNDLVINNETSFLNAMHNIYSSSPFIGVSAKGHAPLLMKSRRKKRVFGNKSFENEHAELLNDNDEKLFEFKLLENDDTQQTDTTQQTETNKENGTTEDAPVATENETKEETNEELKISAFY